MRKQKAPRNSSEDTYRVPFWGDDPQKIEDQEAEGQKEFVKSTTLPTKIAGEDEKLMKSWGFVFGEEVEGDPLFRYVTMPKGWTRASTDHNMHSDVLDDKGRKRAGVFYKAAFYDRRASLALARRYRYTYDYEHLEATGEYVGVVFDCGNIVYRTESLPSKTPDGEDHWENYDKCQALAKAWLEGQYPDWNDPGAYWC